LSGQRSRSGLKRLQWPNERDDPPADLDRLARSTRTEHRLRQRARIVLLAAGGMARRAIGRAVGCTTGTVSKWRVRYAEKRLAGLDETGDRGAEPKYTAETNNRILARGDHPLRTVANS
jgi:transposase-like protein